ncbi:cysteinyl leukotriene receptor 1 [Gouania willdenowi]|uniref:Cysteinyl leukotriene receptor 1-like n=1 Tax=Gouania willdenowi TaxID=441366 RepID=A0A8C5HZF9_GOUWI|nr:cysteinyl leukotriene receptor 1-like [Gouania willdenowi]
MELLNLTDTKNSSTSIDCPSIDEFRNQVYSTSYSLITMFGTVGNVFALVLLIKKHETRSPFHTYMLNLAVSDLLCVMTLPLRVLYYVNKGQWNQGDFLCRISSYALYVNLYCSIYFMAAMSFSRFLAIVFPMQNLRLGTEKHARLVCVGIWLLICLLSLPFLKSGQHIDTLTNKTKCFEPPRGKGLQKLVILNYLSLVLGFAVPFLVILLCYAGIIRTLMSRSHAIQRKGDSGVKAIRMIVIVLFTFLISFMPYHVQRTIHLSFLARSDTTCSEKVTMQKSVVVTLCLAAANSCFDPLLYFFSGDAFRTRLSSMRRSVRGGTIRLSGRLKPVVGTEEACGSPRPKNLQTRLTMVKKQSEK